MRRTMLRDWIFRCELCWGEWDFYPMIYGVPRVTIMAAEVGASLRHIRHNE